MLKHTLHHIELPSTDLARTVEFYSTLLDWAFGALARGDSASEGFAPFETPDGVRGHFRLTPPAAGPRPPVFVVEVPEVRRFIAGAVRLRGGYTTFRDSATGAWTVEIHDPDGNTMRLAHAAVADGDCGRAELKAGAEPLGDTAPEPEPDTAVGEPFTSGSQAGVIASAAVRGRRTTRNGHTG